MGLFREWAIETLLLNAVSSTRCCMGLFREWAIETCNCEAQSMSVMVAWGYFASGRLKHTADNAI